MNKQKVMDHCHQQRHRYEIFVARLKKKTAVHPKNNKINDEI